MPTKNIVKTSVKDLNTADILNVARNEIGGQYASQVPRAVKQGDVLSTVDPRTGRNRIASQADSVASLRQIGEIINTYQPLQNAFLSNLVNRIGMVIIASRLYENPWGFFKKGLLEYGETVEEIYVQLAKPYQYDPAKAEERVFKRRIPDVKAAFHSLNYQKFYPTTVNDSDLKQAFLSWGGVSDLIGRIIEQMLTGANYDEFLVMKYLICQLALKGDIYPVTIPEVSADNARSVTSTMVKNAMDMSFMSKKYNTAHVENYTDPSYLYTIMTTDIKSIFDVEVLALSFHMDKAELLGRQTLVDGFGEIDEDRLALIFEDDTFTNYVPFTDEEKEQLSKIQALMCDESFFMIFDNKYEMTEIFNPEGIYWNYFYHVWKTFSASPFANAILFTTATPSVTSVTVDPATLTAVKGGTYQFTAEVVTEGFAPKSVDWTITGSASADTFIDTNGKLKIASGETATSITVTATSTFDSTKTAVSTVTVTQ